ncbi:hypothetical protein MOK15_21680 [Sphingobium sp. BYY-5]|uniref:hypothetical protein n=1 Tax=Sphingobium sp. BYY-5 TaxID=2926400 RepID=UPI001FA73B31|nr:hypothetical protein [Sphingobium sp. BYY-5]MCI4592672.1 hypothetical protein [Sphingobium sp. BYY-5]
MQIDGLDGSISAGGNSGTSGADAAQNKAAEKVHIAGSTIATAGIAAVLVVVAIPVSLGLMTSWLAKAVARKMSGNQR